MILPKSVLSSYCCFTHIYRMIRNDMNLSSENVSIDFGGIPERRGTTRFPVREEVRYKVLQGKIDIPTGTGKTLNIGSSGILFTTEERLPMGRMVELSVNWPARLGGTCPLKFVAVGRVVRSDSDKAAVRIERYEFKTRALNGNPSGG
jgi:hypothetical protein